jgi:DNA-binding transcriptional regulator YiaG
MTKEEFKTGRVKLGKTQQELATDIGYHVSTIANWEQGLAKVAPGAAAYMRMRLASETEQAADAA